MQGKDSDAPVPAEKKTKSEVHQKDQPAGSHPQKLAFKKAKAVEPAATTDAKTTTPTTPPTD